MSRRYFLNCGISIFLWSCHFQSKDIGITGNWIAVDGNNYINEIRIEGDSICIADTYSYGIKGKVKQVRQELQIQLDKTVPFTLRVNNYIKDSLLQLDTMLFHFNGSGVSDFNNGFEPYRLLGITTKDTLNSKVVFDLVHVVKSKEGILQIRTNDQSSKPSAIIDFLSYECRKRRLPVVALLLSEEVSLTDLFLIYSYLSSMNKQYVYLLTNDICLNRYHCYKDRIKLTQTAPANIVDSSLLLRLPPRVINPNEHLAISLPVEELSDTTVFAHLELGKVYILYLNKHISVKDYIAIKTKLYSIRNNYRINIEMELVE